VLAVPEVGGIRDRHSDVAPNYRSDVDAEGSHSATNVLLTCINVGRDAPHGS